MGQHRADMAWTLLAIYPSPFQCTRVTAAARRPPHCNWNGHMWRLPYVSIRDDLSDSKTHPISTCYPDEGTRRRERSECGRQRQQQPGQTAPRTFHTKVHTPNSSVCSSSKQQASSFLGQIFPSRPIPSRSVYWTFDCYFGSGFVSTPYRTFDWRACLLGRSEHCNYCIVTSGFRFACTSAKNDHSFICSYLNYRTVNFMRLQVLRQ
jgi:hypothetical protein